MAQSPLLFIVAGAALSYILYARITLYIARRRFMKENGCQPCTAQFHKDPILGLDVMKSMAYNSKHHITLQENRKRFQRLGNTYHNRIVTMPFIATCEPENIKTILSLKFKDYSFGNRQQNFTPLLGHGIFNADGERWANSRHLLRPNFARDQVADLEAFERHFQLMLRHIPRDRSTVDLQELFFCLTMDTATEFLFNHSTDTLRTLGQDETNNEDAIFSKAFNYAQDDVATRFRYGIFDRFRKNVEGKEAIKICHAYIEKFVDSALEFRQALESEKSGIGKDDKYYFIQEVAKQTTDKKRIREELINILLAGRDTTASLLSNMFFQIAKRPDIYAKLRDEVATLEGRTPTYSELRDLKYVKWCLNECKWRFVNGRLFHSDREQHCVLTPWFPATLVMPPVTLFYPEAVAQTAKHPSSCPRVPLSATHHTRCTAAMTSLDRTQTSISLSGGKCFARGGSICLSTVAHASASANSMRSPKPAT